MSTNLEYREGERQRKRESRRQAGEAQRVKGRQRSRARDKRQRRHFFVSGGDNVNGQQCKEKMSSSEKKVNKNTYDIASIKKFLEISRCSRAKQRQRNVQKSVLHVQSCFFAN